MNADVEKAVESIDASETVTATPHPDCNALVKLVDIDDWHTIRHHLRDREAEIAALREKADKFMWQVRDTCTRAEKAEALLRMTAINLAQGNDMTATLRIITAHLGGEHE